MTEIKTWTLIDESGESVSRQPFEKINPPRVGDVFPVYDDEGDQVSTGPKGSSTPLRYFDYEVLEVHGGSNGHTCVVRKLPINPAN